MRVFSEQLEALVWKLGSGEKMRRQMCPWAPAAGSRRQEPLHHRLPR